MGAGGELILPLEGTWNCADDLVGGKARGLGRLIAAGYRVPPGFCISAEAYERFLKARGLGDTIRMEIGRKPFADMRWEEIWDAALRIRGAFLSAPLPPDLADPILDAYRKLASGPVAVRSSAPGEDGTTGSFAGLHESVTDVTDAQGLLDAVRIVWGSLWSDAALLYRKELGLDVAHSRMAVLVQEFVQQPVSGVAFGRDPRSPHEDRQMVEAVPGPCEGLVSGALDPDRWILERSTGNLLQWKPGERGEVGPEPLLGQVDLENLHRTLLELEELLGYAPDLEWTGRKPDLTLLQARPVTTPAAKDDERQWYLSLRPGAGHLSDLCERVTDELIPALEAEGARFAAEDLGPLTDEALAEAILARHESHERWKEIYKEDFIPFAHGVRRFGQYYNDAMRPADPFDFVGLLEHQPMMASDRNAALSRLADQVRSHPALASWLEKPEVVAGVTDRRSWEGVAAALTEVSGGDLFRRDFEEFLAEHMNLTYQDESLDERPDLILSIVRQLAAGGNRVVQPVREREESDRRNDVGAREERFLATVGPGRRDEALEVLRIGRLSWRLRDDDNILMGRLRNQLQHALLLGAKRLEDAGRLPPGTRPKGTATEILAAALRDPNGGPVELLEAQVHHTATVRSASQPKRSGAGTEPSGVAGVTPRQLIGQPAAHGLATGSVRVIQNVEDFRAFQRGEILVCDAIQPTMTHLVPLAGAIVERRGGMLIHGAIIARELGVPCVNGVPRATELLRDGELVTVDGYLGIVTVGLPDFDLERERDG